MKKKIAVAVLILLFISAMAGTVIIYKFLNNNSQDNTCFMAPYEKGCFEKLFDESLFFHQQVKDQVSHLSLYVRLVYQVFLP